MPAPATCPELESRKNIDGTGAFCYMLDSSHPSVAAQYGPCESAYTTLVGRPGIVRYCYIDSRGRCKAAPPIDAVRQDMFAQWHADAAGGHGQLFTAARGATSRPPPRAGVNSPQLKLNF